MPCTAPGMEPSCCTWRARCKIQPDSGQAGQEEGADCNLIPQHYIQATAEAARWFSPFPLPHNATSDFMFCWRQGLIEGFDVPRTVASLQSHAMVSNVHCKCLGPATTFETITHIRCGHAAHNMLLLKDCQC